MSLSNSVCRVCGKAFYVIPSNKKRGKGVYCSKECMAIGYKTSVPIICDYCGKQFMRNVSHIKKGYKKSYCSKHCHNMDKVVGNNAVCEQCGNGFYVMDYEKKKGQGRYCSPRCAGIAKRRSDTTLKQIIRTCNLNKIWHDSIIKRDNYRCQACGISSESRSIEVHHIIPMSMIFDIYNIDTEEKAHNCNKLWDISNGISLCRSCHMLIHSGLPLQAEINI